MKEMALWLPGMTLRDSNYGNFRIGQEAWFALQINPLCPAPAAPGAPMLERMETGRYRFLGPILYRHDWRERAYRAGRVKKVFTIAFSVLDLGIQVGCWDPGRLRLPTEAAPGTWWTGEGLLRLDETTPRFESLPAIPPLVYRWRIERILLDETPLTSLTTQGGGRCMGKDKSRERYRELMATDHWKFGLSDYRLECTLLDGPWPNRLPVASIEEQQVATRLLGAALTLVIPGPTEPTGERGPWATRATVLRISPGEPRAQRALLRLDSPLVYEECAYSHAVAYLRYDGEGLDRLVTAGRLFCSVKGLPAEQLESATPFDHHQWPAGAPLPAELRLP